MGRGSTDYNLHAQDIAVWDLILVSYPAFFILWEQVKFYSHFQIVFEWRIFMKLGKNIIKYENIPSLYINTVPSIIPKW
jgi:hypothetical protein